MKKSKCINEDRIIAMFKGVHWLDGVMSDSLLVNFDDALKSLERVDPTTLRITIPISSSPSQWLYKRYATIEDSFIFRLFSIRYIFTVNTITGVCDILPVFTVNTITGVCDILPVFRDAELILNSLIRWISNKSLVKFYMYPSDEMNDNGLLIRDTNVRLFNKDLTINTYNVKRIFDKDGVTRFFDEFSNTVNDRDVGLIKMILNIP